MKEEVQKMRYFYDVLTTAIDNYGVRASFNDLLHAADLFCIKQIK